MLFSRRSRPRGRWRRDYSRFGLMMMLITLTIDSFRLVYPNRSPLAQRVHPSTKNTAMERIFVASIHWNNEAILRSHWNSAVLELTDTFGPDNIYVSILESGSWDDSKGALRDLDAELEKRGVKRKVVLEENASHKELMEHTPATGEEGWVWTSRQRKELRRIPYLANLRNRVMEEMVRLKEEEGIEFTKVLWLNDVIFTIDDILTLLATNSHSYASACSLDFSKPPVYYDTFALRDSSGHQPISSTWPYFLSSHSLSALFHSAPIPVQSCWNGIVAMDPTPFYSHNSSLTGNHGLKFRGVPDDLAAYHLEASECCLIHTDNPLSYSKGVFLNPLVRVGYNEPAYKAVAAHLHPNWPDSKWERVRNMWSLRFRKIFGIPRRMTESWVVKSRLKKWRSEQAVGEEGEDIGSAGEICLINEMQVLAENGWKHV